MIKDTDIQTKLKLGLDGFNLNLPNTYLPTPSNKDYNAGFIYRCVVSRINMVEITEVSSDVFDKIDNNFFKKVKFKWKITGPLKNQYDKNMLTEQGVIDFNKKQIMELNKTMPGLIDIFNNYTQFYKSN